MDRSNIEKIARTAEEKMLLSKLWDKIQTGVRREIPASTGFLSPTAQNSSLGTCRGCTPSGAMPMRSGKC